MDCFQVLANVNNTAMNMGLQLSWDPAFNSLGYTPRREVGVLCGSYFKTLEEFL